MAVMIIVMVALIAVGAPHGYMPSGGTTDPASRAQQSSEPDAAPPWGIMRP